MTNAPRSTSGMQKAAEMLFVACTVLVIALVFLRLVSSSLLYDEVFHFQRIAGLLNGTITLRDWGAMFPGYHLLVAGILKLTGVSSVAAARTVSLLFSLAACGAAYGIAHALDRPSALVRTLQFALFPILLPFFPLIYTDTLSLALLLSALLASLHARSFLSGLLFLLAVFVRQNNVLWAPLLFTIALAADPLWNIPANDVVSWLRAAVKRLQDGPALRVLLRTSIPLLLPVIVFALYIAVTGRASLNPALAVSHPFPSFELGNIFFTLFLFTSLFLPLVLARARASALLLRRPWVLLLLVALFTLFFTGFAVDHPANSEPGRLRDTILLAADAGGTAGLLFWLTGALAVLTMLVTPLSRRSFLWIYPLSVLYLAASWLIETRYAIVPLTLFLLLRKPDAWRREVLQVAFQLAVLIWVFSS